jgi:hypothetical protein
MRTGKSQPRMWRGARHLCLSQLKEKPFGGKEADWDRREKKLENTGLLCRSRQKPEVQDGKQSEH